MAKVYSITRDYMTDLLSDSERNDSVQPEFILFQNSGFMDKFGYDSSVMENYSSMLQDRGDGFPVNYTYIDTLMRSYFEGLVPVCKTPKELKEMQKQMRNLRIADASTMIFTPMEKTTQNTLKKVIESINPNFIVKVLNSDDGITNQKAESTVKDAIRDSNGHPERVIIITNTIGTRSFSIPQIKNIVFLVDGMSSSSIKQKCGRGFTPWDENHRVCKIVEFILTDINNSCTVKWLDDISINTIESNSSNTFEEVINTIDRVEFIEYFVSDELPFRKLNEDDIKSLMTNINYKKAWGLNILSSVLSEVPKTSINIDINTSSKIIFGNAKGESNVKRVATSKHNGDSKSDSLEKDNRQKHLEFLITYFLEVFDSGKFDSDKFKREFTENMSDERKIALSNLYNIDMNVICSIAKILIEKDNNHILNY